MVGSRTPGWLWLHGGVTFTFLYLPVLALILYSFTASESATQWEGFSTRWYRELWDDEKRLQALWTSLKLAAVASLGGGILGTVGALGTQQWNSRRARFLTEGLFLLPIALPDIVLAVTLLACLKQVFSMSAEQAFWRMCLGHVTLTSCYVYLVVQTRLRNLDGRLLEAARDLGATSFQAFRYVQWPLLWPGVLAGVLLGLAVSLDEYVLSSFLGGPGQGTLPVNIQAAIKRNFTPAINALATVMLLVSLFLAIASSLLAGKGK
jgi:putrescine transport system permease protein